MRLIITVITIFLSVGSVFSQIMLGPKVSALYQTYNHEDKSKFKDRDITTDFDWGYNAGIVMIYRAQKKIGLQIEVLYASKNRKLSGGIEDEFSHEANYRYLEGAINFKYYFPRKTFTGYVYSGGRFSHWLSGKGEIYSYEFDESNTDASVYKILFDANDLDDEEGDIFILEPNRIQVGLDFGVGAMINTLHSKNKVMVDLGVQYGHSWLARDHDILVGVDEYREDFRASSISLAMSVSYLFRMDIGQGREGKSTSKVGSKKKRKK